MYQLKIKSVEAGAVKEVGDLSVDPEVLGGVVRARLLQEVCVMSEARKRVGTHKCRNRAEVAGAHKKPWRQKGTGRARSGFKRSPLWRGGSTVFGPRPRDYGYSMSKKSRRRASQSALHSKFRDGEATIVQSIPTSGKTRDIAAFVKALGLTERVLLVTAAFDPMVVRGARNIPSVTVLPVSDLNAYNLLLHKRLVITKDALDKTLAAFGEEKEAQA